ncbi:PPE domain-containing protein [Nocardia sp. NPDC051570]|uniref:PPE domain-containing protein n=1 Tax=Nocardia sp. NPDC051570 TaxID=3364324 RepID=UPI00379D4F5D
MVQSPQAGFTGTVWDAVPAEQLAHELTTGPGTAPMAETGLGYAALAAGLGGAAAEYRAILSVVGDAWGSHSSQDGLAQLGQLADWLDDITTAARHNATTAAQQAASYEIARFAMPHVAEMAQAVHTVEDMVHGSLLGVPLAGLLDSAEQQLDALRDQAAQVMRTYEAASVDLAESWQQDQAPEVSAGAALQAEQAPAPSGDTPQGPPADAGVVTQPALQSAPPVDLSALNVVAPPTVPVGSESLVVQPVLPPFPTGAPTAAAAPVMAAAQPVAAPPPIPPRTAVESPRSPQPDVSRAAAADAGDLGARIVADAGFATAPAVLGASATGRPAVPVEER